MSISCNVTLQPIASHSSMHFRMSTANRKKNDNYQLNLYIFQNVTVLPKNVTDSVTSKLLIINGNNRADSDLWQVCDKQVPDLYRESEKCHGFRKNISLYISPSPVYTMYTLIFSGGCIYINIMTFINIYKKGRISAVFSVTRAWHFWG
jgi:hypothetical protein